MIKTKILLILGAGASAPFGFPLGRSLRDEIYEMLAPPAAQPLNRSDFDNIPKGSIRLLMDAMGDGKSSYPSLIYEKIQDFRKALIRSGRFSVDAFLEHRLDDFGTVGKGAIAVALRKYENPKTFAHMIKEKKNNWYELLIEALIEDVSSEDFCELSGKNLKIITFNYDRSLEHYLHDSLMNAYGITTEKAAEKINEIDIIHVHGKLGDLEWQENPGCVLKYGQELSGPKLAEVAGNINIIPTAIISTPEFEKAGNMIVWADRIFILGFGFNKQNLKRLQLGPWRKDRGGVYGTGMGLRHRDFSTISALKIPNLASLHRRRLADIGNFPFPNKTIYEYLWDDIDLTE